MPRFQQLLPVHPTLRPLISRIQIVSTDAHEAPRSATRIFPSPETSLVGCFDGSFSKRGEALQSALFGIHDESYRLDHCGSATRWSVHFRPGALAFFVRPPANELTHQIVDSHSLFGNEFSELNQRTGEYRMTEQEGECPSRILRGFGHMLEDFLLGQYRAPSRRERYIFLLGDWIRRNLRLPEREKIERACGIGLRQVQRLFLSRHGCSMSTWLRLARFERAIGLLKQKRIPLPDVALGAGYYDQPHFIREFHRIAHFTPSRYAASPLPCDLLEEKNGRMSRSYNTESSKNAIVGV